MQPLKWNLYIVYIRKQNRYSYARYVKDNGTLLGLTTLRDYYINAKTNGHHVLIPCNETLLLVILCVSRMHSDLTYWKGEENPDGFKTRCVLFFIAIARFVWSNICQVVLVFSLIKHHVILVLQFRILINSIDLKKCFDCFNMMNTSYGHWHLFGVMIVLSFIPNHVYESNVYRNQSSHWQKISS